MTTSLIDQSAANFDETGEKQRLFGDLTYGVLSWKKERRIIVKAEHNHLGPILSSAFAGFFTGQGRNWPVMLVNVLTTLANLILDYLLIFGIGIFPEMGIAGAAIATIIAGFFNSNVPRAHIQTSK